MSLVHIGRTKQLFLDDYIIADMHNLRRKLHRPVRYAGNPILAGDRPWEEVGVDLLGGTVLYDSEERLFKMWYRTNSHMC